MAVLTFLPEMRKPKDFRKSIALMQGFQLVVYSIVGGVLYSYGGQVSALQAHPHVLKRLTAPLSQYTPSPALTMTEHKLAIASYAFALVTIIVSGIVAVNVRPSLPSLPLRSLTLRLSRSAPSSSTPSSSATRLS